MSATSVPQRRERPHRSKLAVPATSDRFLSKARESAADVVFIDLEDAVATRLKDEARRKEAMIFGVGDYAVDMRTNEPVFGTPSDRYAILMAPGADGARVRHWNDQWHFAMARIANACRANGLRAVDGPFTDFGDAEGFRASALRAAALGYEGKWAIHPSQIAHGKQARLIQQRLALLDGHDGVASGH